MPGRSIYLSNPCLDEIDKPCTCKNQIISYYNLSIHLSLSTPQTVSLQNITSPSFLGQLIHLHAKSTSCYGIFNISTSCQSQFCRFRRGTRGGNIAKHSLGSGDANLRGSESQSHPVHLHQYEPITSCTFNLQDVIGQFRQEGIHKEPPRTRSSLLL